ncbi:D-beta-hydroxybutyrate dehydrogenase, mitochondrial-like [Arapaima gigas]
MQNYITQISSTSGELYIAGKESESTEASLGPTIQMYQEEALGTAAIATAGYALLYGGRLSCLAATTLAVAAVLFIMQHSSKSALWETHGRAVLITGCDSGFGFHLAKRLDAMGFCVFAGCLFPEEQGAHLLAGTCSRRLKVIKLDVTKDDDVTQAKRFIQSNLPEKGLWAVVNNAGVTDWAETEWNSMSDYYRLAEVNLFGCIRTTVPFLPLIRSSQGRIVFMSSILAFFNCLNMGSYSISKRGLEAFADCLRVEMASFGVKVSLIQPGNFCPATNIVKQKTAQEIWDKLDENQQKMFNKQYIELANEYFKSTCKQGLKDINIVIDALVDALTSTKPKFRYLLVSRVDKVFFTILPYLPTFLSDAVFSLSPMYSKRRMMLYLPGKTSLEKF